MLLLQAGMPVRDTLPIMEERKMEENTGLVRKKGITRVGLRFAVFAVVVIALQIVIATALTMKAPQFTQDNQILLSFLLTIFTIDVVGFPLVWFLNKKLPAEKLEQSPLGAGKFILGILFNAGICGVGAIIGTIIHMGVSLLVGGNPNDNNTIANLMLNSDPFMRILTVGISAPIFEELIFRKVLVDHLVKYGKCVAIAASGIMFGLFHGNFSQCFFAAGLGFFFAYVYIKTGRIRYTIAYHMIINLTTSVITMGILTNYMEAVQQVGMESVMSGSASAAMQVLPATLLFMGWLAVLGIIALVGFILLCVNLKKFRLEEEEGAPTFGKALKMVFTNPGILAFLAVCLFLFVRSYLL